jgi:hypothetical protein
VKYAVIGGFIFWMLYLCSQIYEKGSIADVFLIWILFGRVFGFG